ncbi:hypothetical protein [Elizabethkingia sp. JS20170427COW]|uniref:hypothetical protein n=1 Tax=Elizabethkingia sp. JS20170427COW TaxID=2583851 RepID=UPI0011105BDF|nr:hypothetical protein [Elizabethkingia sp. JS20170427COW]QCX53168.1 hypothetical protein FGE20_05215 [Elizabethkingia sp. JS20170427COW]
MIQDKSATLRLIKQLNQALEKLLLGSPDKDLMSLGLDLDSLMNDIFGVHFEQLSQMPNTAIIAMVEAKEAQHQPSYYELLGNLFFAKYQLAPEKELGEKTKEIYQKYLEVSRVFSLPILKRIGEIS